MYSFLSGLFAKLVPVSLVGKVAAGTVAVMAVTGGGAVAVEVTSTPDTTAVSSQTPGQSPSSTGTTDQTGTQDQNTQTGTTEGTGTVPSVTQPTDTVVPDSANDPTGDAQPASHPANHGGDVSSVAHTVPPGPDHGQAVASAAHNHAPVAHQPQTGDTTGGTVSGAEVVSPPAGGSSHGHGHR